MRAFGIVVAAVALVAVVLIIFRPDIIRGWLSDDPDRESFAANCLKVTGSETELGVGISRSGKSFSSNLGIEEHIEGSENEKNAARILDCVEKAYQKAVAENDFHTRRPLQLGLAADQWSDGGMSLHLKPMDTPERTDILNNLAFGPAGGIRPELIEAWCAQNAACVICEPNLGAANIAGASTVSISLKPDARVKKLHYGTAPLAGNRTHPWQLVEILTSITKEGIGGRVIYQCVRN